MIRLVLLCALLLSACSVATPRQEVVIYPGCDGRGHATVVDVRVGLPALECPAAALAGGLILEAVGFIAGFPTLGCYLWEKEDADRITQAVLWLYPVNFDFVVEREFRHITDGNFHPFFLPFVHSQEC